MKLVSSNFYEYLFRDKGEDINQKMRRLSSFIMSYKTFGEVEGLCGMMDKLVERYGDKITDSHFYWMRMVMALDVEGDWIKAEDSLKRLRQLVRRGVINTNDMGYNAAMRVYYRVLNLPGYEVARCYKERTKNREEDEIERRKVVYENKR